MTHIKEPIAYIEEFNMLSPYNRDFNRVEFLEAFWNDFQEFISKNPGGTKNGVPPTYSRWCQVVNNYYQKYRAISKLRISLSPHKQGLTKRLWGLFYAQYIIPERDRRYPDKAREIYQLKRKRIQEEQDKINAQANR